MIEKITNQNQIARHKLAEKINELVDAVNNQQIQLNNHECRLLDLHSRITALEDLTYHEEPADNSEKANCQENVLTKSLRMDKEFAEEEMERVRKENTDLKNEVALLHKKLGYAIGVLENMKEFVEKIPNRECPCGKQHIWFEIENAIREINGEDNE